MMQWFLNHLAKNQETNKETIKAISKYNVIKKGRKIYTMSYFIILIFSVIIYITNHCCIYLANEAKLQHLIFSMSILSYLNSDSQFFVHSRIIFKYSFSITNLFILSSFDLFIVGPFRIFVQLYYNHFPFIKHLIFPLFNI